MEQKYSTIEELIKTNLNNGEDAETLKLMNSLEDVKKEDILQKKNF